MGRSGLQLGIIFWVLVSGQLAQAAEGAGTESPLNTTVDARDQAMGGTSVAIGDGAQILVRNPANLGWIDQGSLSLFHTSLYSGDTALRAGFVAYPTLEFGTFAAGIERLGVGGIDGRDARNQSLGEFDSSEFEAILGYGRALQPWLAGGLSLRIVQQSVADASATGAGVDLGLAARRDIFGPGHRVQFGLAVRNLISPKLRLDEDQVADPMRTTFGAGYIWNPPTHRLHAAAAVELALSAEADARRGAGIEAGFDHLLFLRGGIDEGRLTAGVGLEFRNIEFSFATKAGGDLPRDDRFTLGYRFGSSVDERLQSRRADEELRVSERLDQMLQVREAEALAFARSEAETAWEAGDYAQVELLSRRVLLMAPADPLALARIDDSRRLQALANAGDELSTGSAARAATAYQRILDEWPGEPAAAEGLAAARQRIEQDRDRQGQIDTLFSEALDRYADKDYPGARTALVELYRLDPGYTGAQDLTRRIEIEENAASAARTQRLADEQKRARSLATRERAPVQRPAPNISAARRAELQEWFELGLREFQAGDYERAVLTWRDVWKVDPRHGNVDDNLLKAYLLLAVDAYADGDYTRALDRCHQALEVKPDDEKAGRYLARIEEERAGVREIENRRNGR